MFFALLSLAFKALLQSGFCWALWPHHFPTQPPFPCSRFPRPHPFSRPLAMLSLLPRLASRSLEAPPTNQLAVTPSTQHLRQTCQAL